MSKICPEWIKFDDRTLTLNANAADLCADRKKKVFIYSFKSSSIADPESYLVNTWTFLV
jgi:hypothetical protein